MKTKLGILILLLAATLARAQTNNLTALLQQGLFEEQANRNLDAAIADYQALARQFDKDRQLVATAVFRLGECYRMQGKTNEAALEYQRILHDFSDQTTLATLSQQDLTGMGMSPAPAASAALQTQKDLLAKQIALAELDLTDTQHLAQIGMVPQDQVRAAEREMLRLKQQLAALDSNNAGPLNQPSPAGNSDANLWDKLKNLPPDQLVKVLPTLVPDAVLMKLLQQRDDAEAKLAELKVDFSTNNPAVMEQKAVSEEINKQISERISGIMQALQMRAELAQTSVATSAPPDEETQEIARIQQMIQNSPDLINAPDSNGHTPLGNAAAHGWLKAAAYLLDHGAEVNANARGGTALLDATQAGNRTMVEFLLAHGANVNGINNNPNRIPMVIAVQHGFEAVTKALLNNKADVNVRDLQGNTPLFIAAQPGKTNIFQMLLAAGADVNVENDEGRTPLSFAAENGSLEMLKLLLAAKADPNGGKLDAPLLCAIYNKDVGAAELLLQAGAKPNATGNYDLWRQTGRRGRSGGVFGGGRGGGSPNGFGNSARPVTPLWLAISGNQFSMVQLLLKFKADPNDSQTDGRPLLFSALSDTNILEMLLKVGAKADMMGIGADPNGANVTASGYLAGMGHEPGSVIVTPLSEAVWQNNAAAVEILLKHGANPNVRDSIRKFAPLHWAALKLADRKVFEMLLTHKADQNLRDGNGQTPLDILKEKAEPGNLTTDTLERTKAGELADWLRQQGALD